MMTGRNMRRRGEATWASAATALLGAIAVSLPLLLGPPARGSADVAPAHVMESYRELESWVRIWRAPEAPASIDPAGATGACVTLRYSGVVVGRAARIAESDDEEGTTIWRAARAALAEAIEKMPVGQDALRRERLLEAAPAITIDLQVAGELTPLGGRTFQEAVLRLTPGLDGVAARRGGRIESVFPGTMLSTNLSTSGALSAAVNELQIDAPGIGSVRIGIGDPRISLRQLRDDFGLVVYMFRVQHIAQVESGGAPRFLFRGGRVVNLGEMSMRSLRSMADQVAEHLLAHKWPREEPLGLMGTLRPWLGTYEEPVIAPPADQAMAALALARFGDMGGAAGAEWTSAAVGVLGELAVVESGEQDPAADAVSSALYVLAARAARGAMIDHELSARSFDKGQPLANMRRRCEDAIAEWAASTPDERPSLRAPAEALVAAALAEGDPPQRAAATEIVRRLFRETGPGELVNLMPWLGWAELALARGEDQAPAGIALRDLRNLIWRHQITASDAGDEPDLVGGIVFTASSQLLPSWQSARPLAFVATMLGDPRLTDDDEVAQETVRLLSSLRWLRQLMVKDEEMHMFRDRDLALGGVRLALWDQRLSLEASALTLLTVVEALESLEKRRDAISGE